MKKTFPLLLSVCILLGSFVLSACITFGSIAFAEGNDQAQGDNVLLRGDMNEDGIIDASDINLLTRLFKTGSIALPDAKLASPVILVEKGSDTNIVWDAVENAVSYVVNVNGTDMPAQTECSYALADDGEYTVTVRAIASIPSNNSEASNAIKLSYGFNESAVVLTFAAYSDVHVSTDQKGGKVRDMMLKTLQKYNVDAFLFAGDNADAQTTNKYDAVPRTAMFAAGVAQGNAQAQLPVIWCAGNHDFSTYTLEAEQSFTNAVSGNSHYFPAGTVVYDATLEILEDATSTFFSEDVWPDATLTVPAGFRYNKVNGFSFFSVDYTHVNADTLVFLEAQLDALVAKEPAKQIFVMSHMPQKGSSQPAGFTDLLKGYPQVVYLSGHSHDTLQTYSTVVAGNGFLEFNLGPGDHASYGVSGGGNAYNNYQMKQGAIIEVDENGHMRFRGIDFSLEVTEDGIKNTLKDSFVVVDDPAVVRTAYFASPTATASSAVLYDSVINNLNDERYHTPYYPEAPTASFTEMTANGGKVTFSAADAANVILYYNVSLKDKTTGDMIGIYDRQAKNYTTALKMPANHIYYPSGDYMPDTLTLDLVFESAIDTTHDYYLYVQGIDDFGKSTVKYAFAFDMASGADESTGFDAAFEPLRINASMTSADYTTTAPRKKLTTTATDLSNMLFTVSDIELSGAPKGFGLLLLSGIKNSGAYDDYGVIAVYGNNMITLYRTGSKSGNHASTGGGHLTPTQFIGAVKLDVGATEFTLHVKEEASGLAFYVNGTLAGVQELTEDGKFMIGEKEFDYKNTKFLSLVPCYYAPSTTYDFYLGSQALAEGDSISFTLDYGRPY